MNQIIHHIAILGVDHDQHPVFRCFHHRAEQGLIVNLKHTFIGHEQLQAGDTIGDQRWDFIHDFRAQVGDCQMEAIIDLRFRVSFPVPICQTIMQTATFRLDDKINVCRRATESRCLVTRAKIVAADRAAKWQFKVCVNIDSAGHQVFAFGVNDLVPLFGDRLTQ